MDLLFIFGLISAIILVMIIVPVAYYYILVAGAFIGVIFPRKNYRLEKNLKPSNRFYIAIAAHNEEDVIGNTVKIIRQSDYPEKLFDVHIVADYCTDQTAKLARDSGAIVYERNEGPRTGKGTALSYLLNKYPINQYDAVIIFDADTHVDKKFLKIMDIRFQTGSNVIQGNHIIRNPHSGWLPSLTYAMFVIENKFRNFGRVNLGLSSKNMGDSICFRSDILLHLGLGDGHGLTEDYQLRQKLLLQEYKIDFEPEAKGLGEAAVTWEQVKRQRTRWIYGTQKVNKEFGRKLLFEGFKKRSLLMLDGALDAMFPAYATLTLVSTVFFLIHIAAFILFGIPVHNILLYGWGLAFAATFAFPFIGLALEKVPLKAYLAFLIAPLFMVWRTWTAVTLKLGLKEVVWVRTKHGDTGSAQK